MKEKTPRHNYEIRIPPNATKEEIAEFMKKFKSKWFGKEEPTEPASKPDEASS
jgi:hypothetical protein